MADAIVVEDVSRRFWRTAALEGVSFSVEEGELFGVIGPDGAGKTTLMRMMAGVLDPSAPQSGNALRDWLKARIRPPTGHVTVHGHDAVAEAEAVKAQTGYMPQNFGLYGDLSVEENLAFAADVFELDPETRRERLRELLDFAELQAFRQRHAARLSGGMKKKLALAAALLHRPAVLLLDEPTTGVDPVARREFWDLLSGLHAEGITTVVTTPYMDEAERCNRVVLLFEGQVLAIGTPAEIKAQVPGQVIALRDTDIRAVGAALEGLAGLLDVQTYGDQLNVVMDEAIPEDEALCVVRNQLKETNVNVGELVPVPVRMEEAFIYLVGRAKSQGKAV